MTTHGVDISPEELKIVLDILRKHVPGKEVWAFGSRSKGKSWQYSDLDLAIITERPMSFSLRGSIAEDFSESDLPFRVDILDWATTSESFRRIVKEQKIVIQPRIASA